MRSSREAARRTTITGSPVETIAFRSLLAFLSDEQFAKVSVTAEDLSILARYSWAIPIPPQLPSQSGSLPPKEDVLNALKSPVLRTNCHSRMAGGYDLHIVEITLVRLSGLIAT